MKTFVATFFVLWAAALTLFFCPTPSHAQSTPQPEISTYQDLQAVLRAKVIAIESETVEDISGTQNTHTVQRVRAEILEGEMLGQNVAFDNDFIRLKTGDTFYLNYLRTINGDELFSVRELDRRISLIFFVILFCVVIIAFGGKQGVRSILSLAMTLVTIIYVLLPLLLRGYSPVLVSSVLATVVLAIVIFTTHGRNRESTAAFLGTMSAVIISSILAMFAIAAARLTGFSSDESVYLNLYTGGTLNFAGLLLGGIIMGSLGVLDDISITQAAIVHEFYHATPNASKKEVFFRALRIGREHVGALVNTLALAYAGASLPALLLLSMSQMPIGIILNSEVIATEIIRTIVGSIGLVLAVPITTYIAVHIFRRHPHGTVAAHSHSHGHSH